MNRPQRNPAMPATVPQDATDFAKRHERRIQIALDLVDESIDACGVVQVHVCRMDEVIDQMDAFCHVFANPKLTDVQRGGILIEGTSADQWGVLLWPEYDTDDTITLATTDDRQIWLPRTRDQFDRELVSAIALCDCVESVHATLHQDDEYRSRHTHPLYSETQTARFVLTLPGERDHADPDTEWEPVGLLGSLDEICYLLYRGEYSPRDQSLTLDRTVWLYRLVTVSPVDPSVLHWGPIHASPGECAGDLPCPE